MEKIAGAKTMGDLDWKSMVGAMAFIARNALADKPTEEKV
jgi:hypothetical protein